MKTFLLLLLVALSAGCSKPKRPVAWWIQCRHDIQAPADRVGSLVGNFFYTDKFESELYGCLPTPIGFAVSSFFRSIYSVKLTDLHAGDILNFSANAEVTNDLYGDDILVDWYFILAPNYTDTVGERITRSHGYNCTSPVHHCILGESDFYQLTKDYPEIYLNFVVYSAASSMDDAYLVIEQHYGQMTGLVIRNNP